MGHRSVKWVLGSFAAMVLAAFVSWNWWRESTADIVVYKSSTCSCCDSWVTHLRGQGFVVYVRTQEHLARVRAKYGVPDGLGACHTARAGRYTIEGHVPAADIRRLLRERPAVTGIAVPGMPIGSPGMERGTEQEPFEVLAFDSQGRTAVFAKH